MPPSAAQVSFLRALKGAPASILMALLFTGRAHTQRELQLTTGYSDKPVSDGLALLEMAGIVHRDDIGWLLAARPEELTRLLTGRSEQLSTTRKISDPPSSTTTDIDPSTGDKSVVVSTGHNRKNSVPEADSVDNLDTAVENPAAPVDESPPSPPPLVENLSPAPPTPTGGQPSALPDRPSVADESAIRNPKSEIEMVRAWLERAGVGSHSPKMHNLLAAGLSARYVQAHVLEREYRLRWRLIKPRDYKVGLLIRRLEDRDPAPLLRCPVCLEQTPCRCP